MRLVWRRIQRTAVWYLLPLLLLQFLSGCAMIHWRLLDGFLTRVAAFGIHSIIQPMTLAAAGAELVAFGSYLTIQG